MVYSIGLAVRSLDVLIEIPRFQICFFAKPVTHSNVKPVLIKPITIHMTSMRRVDEHFILHSRKKTFAESTQMLVHRYYNSVEIAKSCSKPATDAFQLITYGHNVWQPAFFQPKAVLEHHRFA